MESSLKMRKNEMSINKIIGEKNSAVKISVKGVLQPLADIFHLGLAAMGLFDTSELDQELGNWENWTGIA